jgi:hypothetical protein
MTLARSRVLVASIIVAMAASGTVESYSHIAFELGGQVRAIRWTAPSPRWYATDRNVPGVSASQFQQELERAFAAWEAVPTASIAFSFAGFTSAPPFEDDDLSVFGFEAEPDLDRVLGATTFVVDVATGEIIESDVFFNSAFPWSVAPAGEAGRFDLRSVATHEIGHFMGLGHSAIGETELRPDGTRRVLGSGAVMFPISLGRGVVADRVLQPDDVAGVSELYPDGDFEDATGVIAGRVRMGEAGVFGAHVVAFNPRTGSLVGTFAGQDGTFSIGGLTPGAHVIRVEPLDDGDLESFLSSSGVNVDFQVTFHPRLVAAPKGGATPTFDVTVRPK